MDNNYMSDYEYACAYWPTDENINDIVFKHGMFVRKDRVRKEIYLTDADGSELCRGETSRIEGFLYGYDYCFSKIKADK